MALYLVEAGGIEPHQTRYLQGISAALCCPHIVWSPYQDSNLDHSAPNRVRCLITLYRDEIGRGTWNRTKIIEFKARCDKPLHYTPTNTGDAWENRTPVFGQTIRDNDHYMNAPKTGFVSRTRTCDRGSKTLMLGAPVFPNDTLTSPLQFYLTFHTIRPVPHFPDSMLVFKPKRLLPTMYYLLPYYQYTQCYSFILYTITK